MRVLLSTLLLAVLALPVAAQPKEKPKDEEIEVHVLAILASTQHRNVHAKLTEFAALVQKSKPELTGFDLDRTTVQPLELGQTHKFDLVGEEKVEVTVNKQRNPQGRITLTIKPPGLMATTYECVCEKFFATGTQHYVLKGKDKQQLFVAIMAKPCGMTSKNPSK